MKPFWRISRPVLGKAGNTPRFRVASPPASLRSFFASGPGPPSMAARPPHAADPYRPPLYIRMGGDSREKPRFRVTASPARLRSRRRFRVTASPAGLRNTRSQDSGWLRHLPGFASFYAGRPADAFLHRRPPHAADPAPPRAPRLIYAWAATQRKRPCISAGPLFFDGLESTDVD